MSLSAASGLPGWIPPVAVLALYVLLPLVPVGPNLHRALWLLALLGFAAALTVGLSVVAQEARRPNEESGPSGPSQH